MDVHLNPVVLTTAAARLFHKRSVASKRGSGATVVSAASSTGIDEASSPYQSRHPMLLISPTTPGSPRPPGGRPRCRAGLRHDGESEATRRAYRSDFRIFAAWCRARGAEPVPASAEMVGAFLSAEALRGTKASTISRRAAAIRYAHAVAGLEPPTNTEAVKAIIRGIRRTIGTAATQKAPATAERVVAMLASVPDSLKGRRDRALLALGFSGAFRRSELVALTVADLKETPDSLRVLIRRSKTDQEGAGHEIAIPRGVRLRVVEAVSAWVVAECITEGPIFRQVGKGGRLLPDALTPQSVANLVKHYVKHAGLDPAVFSGHSPRAGFLTSAAEHGASVFKIMEVSRHKSVDTLRGYVRRADMFRDHAGAGFL